MRVNVDPDLKEFLESGYFNRDLVFAWHEISEDEIAGFISESLVFLSRIGIHDLYSGPEESRSVFVANEARDLRGLKLRETRGSEEHKDNEYEGRPR